MLYSINNLIAPQYLHETCCWEESQLLLHRINGRLDAAMKGLNQATSRKTGKEGLGVKCH
jgi:hypothetical protein